MTQQEVIASLEAEMVIASVILVEEAAKLSVNEYTDTTGMVVVPQPAFERLERAVQLRADYGLPAEGEQKK